MLALVLALALALARGGAEAGAELSAALRGPPAAEVSAAFLSLTLDASLATAPQYIALLGNRKLRTLAKGLSPGFLRFGGTKTDFLIFDPTKDSTLEERELWELQGNQDICGVSSTPFALEEQLLIQWPIQEKLILEEQYWKKHNTTTITRSTLDILYNFANCSEFQLVFGLNALLRKGNSQWDSSNAQLLLDYCASQKYNMSWELGNEPNSFRKKSGMYIDGFQLGQDFVHLRHLLSNYSFYRNSKLYGPDVGQPRKNTQKLLRSFLKSGGKVIDSVTWHHDFA